MRVGIVASIAPFVKGGGRLIVDWTAEEFRKRGHEVEQVLIPMSDSPDELLAQLAGIRTMPLNGFDRVVAIRWPANVISHDNKVAWFIHHYRALFDLWDTPYRNVPDTIEGRSLREAIRVADTTTLKECRSVFSNSAVVSKRLAQYNGVDSSPLYPPLGGDLSRFRCDNYGDYILYPARLATNKRQLLAIEAMRHTETPVRLVLMGTSESPGYTGQLHAAADDRMTAGRILMHDRWVDESEKVDGLADCLGVAYLPLDEDSYGYTSLEAAHSHKAIITTTDSGGVLEFVEEEGSGLICDPTPQSVAAAFDRLYRDRHLARSLGNGANERLSAMRISWDTVEDSLLRSI